MVSGVRFQVSVGGTVITKIFMQLKTSGAHFGVWVSVFKFQLL
jgi:hypothetical protein